MSEGVVNKARRILPDAVRGSSAIISMCLGILYGARRSRQCALMRSMFKLPSVTYGLPSLELLLDTATAAPERTHVNPKEPYELRSRSVALFRWPIPAAVADQAPATLT